MKNIQIPCVCYSIRADWYEGEKDEVLLVLPGWKSSKAKYVNMVESIVEQTDMSVLVIDYSGHGESPFELDDLTPAHNFLEVVTAFDWIQENHSGKKITVMGTSYGGFMTAQLAKYRKFDRAIFRVPALYPPEAFYTKWGEVGPNHYQDYRSKENLSLHPVLTRAKGVKGKSLVVTHELDEVCPPNTTDPFISNFEAEHWVIPGFKHGFHESGATEEQMQKQYDKLSDWLNMTRMEKDE